MGHRWRSDLNARNMLPCHCNTFSACTYKEQRRHLVEAGINGDGFVAAEALVQPIILHYILKQNFAALWTSPDTVWLQDPMLELPALGDPVSVRIA